MQRFWRIEKLSLKTRIIQNTKGAHIFGYLTTRYMGGGGIKAMRRFNKSHFLTKIPLAHVLLDVITTLVVIKRNKIPENEIFQREGEMHNSTKISLKRLPTSMFIYTQ